MTRTILFMHGAWLSPASWSPFKEAFEAKGFACVTPAWPTMDRPVEELRRQPDPALARLGIREIADHYAGIARGLTENPILLGHSFGGLMVQLLLDRGIGVAGVAVDPAPPWGVLVRPRAVATSWAVLRTWQGWRKIHTMSEAAFRTGFGYGMTPEQQTEAYRTLIVPAPGRIFYQVALGKGSKVNFANPNRAPLLITAGELDRPVPPGMIRDNYAKAKKSPAPTELRIYPGRGHFLLRQDGWQEIAADVLAWLDGIGVTGSGPAEPPPPRNAIEGQATT